MNDKHNVLLICDSDFKFKVKDYEKYCTKLKEFLKNKNDQKEIILNAVKGKYCFDDKISLIDIDDKNKTSFVKTINDYLNKFDEVVIITNYLHEPFLESLRTQLNEENKATTIFSYETRESHEYSQT